MTRWSDPAAPSGDSEGIVPPPPGESAAGGDGGVADDDTPDRPWLQGDGLGGQLHPAAIGVWSLAQVGALALVAIINPVSIVALLPIAALLVAANAIRWSRFRWQVVDGTLVISQGLIQRHRRVIPLERIQSVDVIRRISHRVFRVEALNVEAIGGSDTEGQLDALAPPIARQVRAALLAGRDAARSGDSPQAGVSAALTGSSAGTGATAQQPPDESTEVEGTELARVSGVQLVRAGLTEANVTVLAAAAGFGWQLLSERVEQVAQQLPRALGPGLAVAAVLGLLVVAILLLILGQLLTYWNFRLHLAGDALHVRRGLLEQRFDTIPLRRIQALRIEENVPRRLFGYAAVKADVAGKPGGGSTGTDTLLPFGTTAQARELVATILDDPAAADADLRPMPRRARTRRRVRAVAGTVVVTAAAVVPWGWAGLAAGLVAVPLLAAADAAYRALGWSRDHGLLVARAGWWTRRTAFVPEHRLQTLARTATVLQRWRRLATVELQIARSPGLWSGPRWIDLDAGDADRQTLGLAEAMRVARIGGAPRPADAPSPPAGAGERTRVAPPS